MYVLVAGKLEETEQFEKKKGGAIEKRESSQKAPPVYIFEMYFGIQDLSLLMIKYSTN